MVKQPRNREDPQKSSRPARPGGGAFLEPGQPGKEFLRPQEWAAVRATLHLTARQVEVAALLMEGLTRKAIARRLGIGVQTVRTHIDRLFENLRVKHPVELGLRLARIREMLGRGAETAGPRPAGKETPKKARGHTKA